MLTVLSLGACVQSTTLLLMSHHGDLPRLDAAIFANTHFEPRAVYAHLAWLESVVTSIPIYRVSAGNLRRDVEESLTLVQDVGKHRVGRFGQPPFYVRNSSAEARNPGLGMLWRKCTKEYKIVPIERKLRELLGFKPRQRLPQEPILEQWKGISVDEMQRASCSRVKWIKNRYPLIEERMRRDDCLHWLAEHGYPEPPKSACIGCPYHSDALWRKMKDEAPEDWADAVAFDNALRVDGKRIPGTYGQSYVHRSAIPLDLVDFTTAHERTGQINLFADKECTVTCGV